MNDYIFDFGTPVSCYDKQCGKLAKVAFNSNNWQVSNLIVEEGLLLKQARVFPFSTVEQATEEEITIAVHEGDLRDYPEYRETIVETMPEGGVVEPALIQGSPHGLATSSPVVPMVQDLVVEGVADHLDILDKETPLKAADGTVGKVRGLAVVAETGLITHVLIHKGTIFVEEFWLSTAVVERISTEGVFLGMTKDALDDLVEYDRDRDHYWDSMPTDEVLETVDSDAGPFFVGTDDVSHNGTINSGAALAVLIADAFMDDPRTEDAVIEVIHERGMITLQGTVDDPETRAAAEEIASAYPGVVSVTNELVVDQR